MPGMVVLSAATTLADGQNSVRMMWAIYRLRADLSERPGVWGQLPRARCGALPWGGPQRAVQLRVTGRCGAAAKLVSELGCIY
jgi:hypothetical protein